MCMKIWNLAETAWCPLINKQGRNDVQIHWQNTYWCSVINCIPDARRTNLHQVNHMAGLMGRDMAGSMGREFLYPLRPVHYIETGAIVVVHFTHDQKRCWGSGRCGCISHKNTDMSDWIIEGGGRRTWCHLYDYDVTCVISNRPQTSPSVCPCIPPSADFFAFFIIQDRVVCTRPSTVKKGSRIKDFAQRVSR